MPDFTETIARAYATDGPAIDLGRGVHEDELSKEAVVQIPLRMVSRHGLVAGATGTGKTATLQVLTEELSAVGVPVFVADIKGDVSGISAPGKTEEGPAPKRMAELGIPYAPAAFPTQFLALGGTGPGVPVRATVSDFGPQLLAKALGANETQEQSLALLFRFADQKQLPLLDLADVRALLSYLDSDQGKVDLQRVGGVSSQTIGVLLRSLVGLEDGGGNEFFGEPQLEIADLLQVAPDGRGVVSCVELAAVQEHPELFSTALMWLPAELFEELPEVGDLDKPKLVFFLDEAHLLFDGATPAFVPSIERTVRLIRSKGVGVFFVTQSPKDVHEDVLAQLGNRVQHALRAFTPDDKKALKATAGTYPTSEFYDVETLLTSVGIGEAAVTLLSEKGVPTPVVHCRPRAPASRMGPADDVDGSAKASPLWAKYGTVLDRESAQELLAARLAPPPAPEPPAVAAPAPAPTRAPPRKAKVPATEGPVTGGAEAIGSFLNSRQGKQIQKEVVRGIFGLLKKGR